MVFIDVCGICEEVGIYVLECVIFVFIIEGCDCFFVKGFGFFLGSIMVIVIEFVGIFEVIVIVVFIRG